MKYAFPSYKDVPVKGRLKKCLTTIRKFNLNNKTLVDVGCSNGWLEYQLQKYPLKDVIAIDPNKKAISFAKKNNNKFIFNASPANDIPAKNSSVDIVTMFDVIEHVPKRSELPALKESFRVLKKGGKLLLSTPNCNFLTNLLDPAWYFGHRHYSVNKMLKMLKDSGFRVREIEVVGRLWSIFYMLWFYIEKFFFGKPLPRNKWIEEKDDKDYLKKGFFTLFIIAEKI